MGKKNCWEVMGCGHGPEAEAGEVCAAAKETRLDGVNRGHNGGRVCWAVAGTFGNPGAVKDKLPKCVSCRFLQLVQDEEGRGFVLLEGLLEGVKDRLA